MEKPYINHLAVFVCAVLSLAIGGLWYSPLLFFRAWQKETGLTDEQVARANPLKTYSLTFFLAWIISPVSSLTWLMWLEMIPNNSVRLAQALSARPISFRPFTFWISVFW